MVYNSEQKENLLSKILDQTYDSASFLFDVSNGANFIITTSGRIIIANSNFFELFLIEYKTLSNNLYLEDFFSEDESENLKFFLNERISDPYNSPKTAVFSSDFFSKKETSLILTAIKIPGTDNILVSAAKPESVIQSEKANYQSRNDSGAKKLFSYNSFKSDIYDENYKNAYAGENSAAIIDDEVKQRPRQLELLNQILISVNSAFNLNEMLDNILDLISGGLGFEICFIYLKNADGKSAEIISAREVPRYFLETEKKIDVRSWPNNLVFYAGQPKFIENLPDIDIGKHDLKILENLGALSYSAIPLISDNTVIGALYTAKADEGIFSDFEKETLLLIGKEISNLILRGMLQERLEKECSEAKQCFGLILDDINDLNEELLRSVESITEPEKSLDELAEKMSGDIRKNRYIINNLRIINEINENMNRELSEVSLDDEIKKAADRYPGIRIRYTDSGHIVYSDENLSEVFASIIQFMANLGAAKSDIAIYSEQSGDTAIVTIQNTGPGLSDEEKMLLFSDFDEENIHLDSGSIGLYTAYILIKKYGGRISVADRIAGDRYKGLSFKLILGRCST